MMRMPVAIARAIVVKKACHGLRSRFRKDMRRVTVNHFEIPSRSTRAGRKLAGGSGRMASAGASLTTLRTAPDTPTNAAAVLASKAPMIAPVAGTNSNRGNRKNK